MMNSSLNSLPLRRRVHQDLLSARHRLGDIGQVGPIVIFVLGFVMLGVYWIMLSPLVDQSIDIENNYPVLGMVSTQERSDAIFTLATAFNAFIVFAVVVLVVWLILQSLREREGGVW